MNNARRQEETERSAGVQEGDLLWQPSPQRIGNANLSNYLRWLARHHKLHFDSYAALWRWSVEHVDEFWQSVWDYFDVVASVTAEQPLAVDLMPGAVWFPGARLNYAENIFRQQSDSQPALLFQSETDALREVSWQTLQSQTAQLAHALRQIGVTSGDRVVGYLPNIPEAVVAVLATISIGAVWSSCSPDFGSRSVLDRFRQIEPTVLIAVDAYQYNGKRYDRIGVISELQLELPSLQQVILIGGLHDNTDRAKNHVAWEDIVDAAMPIPELAFAQVAFDHPLWILYSSGTTGLPKPIVHGHGGNLLEHYKQLVLHHDLKREDRFFWYTSTGWMMWNFLVASLLSGCTIVLYDGSPAYPSLDLLWRLAEEAGVTYFGTSPAFLAACQKSGREPKKQYDLGQIRSVGSTGAPLTPFLFDWIYQNVGADLAVESVSGGTDLCTAFLGGSPLLPVYAGEIQARSLGAGIEAFDQAGQPVVDEVGELVITRPMPSMPVRFWNDEDGGRYRSSYFEQFPGVWRHGDWIKINRRGGCIIYGRSDSTINRKGVRMGTSEIYQVVEAIPQILDSLVIDLEALGHDSYMPLFVVLREDATLDDSLVKLIRDSLRQELSPRHVPDEIFTVTEIPYTLSGKKMEVPIRRILLGHTIENAVNRGAMRNPAALDYFIHFAERLQNNS